MSDCSRSFADTVDDYNIYIFMYVNVLIENTYEVRVMFDSIRIDSQVMHLATAHLECAAWVRNSHFRCSRRRCILPGLIPSIPTWLRNTHA